MKSRHILAVLSIGFGIAVFVTAIMLGARWSTAAILAVLTWMAVGSAAPRSAAGSGEARRQRPEPAAGWTTSGAAAVAELAATKR